MYTTSTHRGDIEFMSSIESRFQSFCVPMIRRIVPITENRSGRISMPS